MRTRNTLIAIVAVVAVLGAACTSETADSTTTTLATTTTVSAEIPDLEFGSGSVPFTVPVEFPLPDSAVVGTTMIDGVNGRSEMNVNFPASVTEVVTYYETNLPALGFQVTDSKGTDSEWDITFAKDGATGTIRLVFGGTSVTTGTLSFDHA
jgi:hypothetical protein